MAPNTRLRANPALRVSYDIARRRKKVTNAHPNREDNSTPAVLRTSRAGITKSKGKATCVHAQEAGAPSPFRSHPPPQKRDQKPRIVKRTAVETEEPKAEVVAKTKKLTSQGCDICATVKRSRSFVKPKGDEMCAHLLKTCRQCLHAMIISKIKDGRLGGDQAMLECPYAECGVVMNVDALKQILSPSIFKKWEDALSDHFIRASPNFIACLNPKCGKYSSAEGCQAECPDQRDMYCWYCDKGICMRCNRPSHSYPSCDKLQQEDTEKALTRMGAKKCPNCHVYIEKNMGCDHMTCRSCRQEFCWVCLVKYTRKTTHGPGCQHGRQNIANDPRNYYNGPVEQLFRPA